MKVWARATASSRRAASCFPARTLFRCFPNLHDNVGAAGENGKASRRRLDLEHAHAESGVRAHVGESCQSHEARKQPHLGFVGVFAGANPEVSLGGFDSSG